MSERVKTWGARALFALSLFALLGTSQPRWSVDAAVPHDTPAAAGHVYKVSVESSRSPYVRYVNRVGEHQERGRFADVEEATVKDFFLPPGAALEAVDISGHCSGGCFSGDCVPPKSSYVRAKSELVTAWTKTAKLDAEIKLTPNPQMMAYVVVTVEAKSSADVEVVMQGPPTLGWSGKPTEVRCHDPIPDAGTVTVQCDQYPFTEMPKAETTMKLTVEATSWGACSDPKAPCEPPLDAPSPRIVSVVGR